MAGYRATCCGDIGICREPVNLKHAVVQADPLAGRAVALLAHHAQLADGGAASGFRDHAFR